MTRSRTIPLAAATLVAAALAVPAAAADPAYFTEYENLAMSRDDRGVLTVEMHTDGGPIVFDATAHEEFVDAFYDIGRDRQNAVVILTGVGDWMASIDFASFGDVGDPDVWAKVHDEGTQVLENIANIRVPVISAIEGKAWVHTEYALLANIIVAAESATFNDAPHFAGGIIPGDGIFTTWSWYAGPGRAQAFLLDPRPIPAAEAKDWGVVTEVVPDGTAVERAREIAHGMIEGRPALTLRNTRIHFIQPLKERIVREVGYGLALEGASAAALVKQLRAGEE